MANAGAAQTVEPWATITLSATEAITGVTTRSWTQLSGTTVALTGSGTTRTFTAPPSIEGGVLTFRYTGTTAAGAVDTGDTTVTVLPVTERAAIGGVEVPMRLLDAVSLTPQGPLTTSTTLTTSPTRTTRG